MSHLYIELLLLSALLHLVFDARAKKSAKRQEDEKSPEKQRQETESFCNLEEEKDGRRSKCGALISQRGEGERDKTVGG